MKIKVLIHRQRANEEAEGTLRAYVMQEGKRGSDLLSGKRFMIVDSAICEADKRLMKMFKLIEPGGIDYEVDEDPKRAAQ